MVTEDSDSENGSVTSEKNTIWACQRSNIHYTQDCPTTIPSSSTRMSLMGSDYDTNSNNIGYPEANTTPIVKIHSGLNNPKAAHITATPVLQVVDVSGSRSPSPTDLIPDLPIENKVKTHMHRSSISDSSKSINSPHWSLPSNLMKGFMSQYDDINGPHLTKSTRSLPSVIIPTDDDFVKSWEQKSLDQDVLSSPIAVAESLDMVQIPPLQTCRSGHSIFSEQEDNDVNSNVNEQSQLRNSRIVIRSHTDPRPSLMSSTNATWHVEEDNENEYNNKINECKDLSVQVDQLQIALRTERCMGDDMRDRIEELEAVVKEFKVALQSSIDEASKMEDSYIRQREATEKKYRDEIERLRVELIETTQQNVTHIDHNKLSMLEAQNIELRMELEEKTRLLSDEKIYSSELRNQLKSTEEETLCVINKIKADTENEGLQQDLRRELIDVAAKELYSEDKLSYRALYDESQINNSNLWKDNEALTETIKALKAELYSNKDQLKKSIVTADHWKDVHDSIVMELANLKVVLAEYKGALDRLDLTAPFPETFTRNVLMRKDILSRSEGRCAVTGFMPYRSMVIHKSSSHVVLPVVRKPSQHTPIYIPQNSSCDSIVTFDSVSLDEPLQRPSTAVYKN